MKGQTVGFHSPAIATGRHVSLLLAKSN
jgi:hypothetical protein